jgi:hypothetical protein
MKHKSRGSGSNFHAFGAQSSAVCKIMPSCLLWCLQREMNFRSFKDRERTLEELKSFFF